MTAGYLGRRKPRQLDIINDTALSARPENGARLSTARVAGNGPYLSTGPDSENGGYLSIRTPLENGGDLSTKPAPENGGDLSTGFRRFDAKRRELGISIAKLCAAAGIHPNTYDTMRKGEAATRPTTMLKLRRAFNRLATGEKADAPRSLFEIGIRMFTADLARQVGADPVKVLAANFETENTNDPEWLQASRLRRAAIYLMVEGVGIAKADAGHALGITRQAVHKAVAVIELERDRDNNFDRIMREMMVMVAVQQ